MALVGKWHFEIKIGGINATCTYPIGLALGLVFRLELLIFIVSFELNVSPIAPCSIQSCTRRPHSLSRRKQILKKIPPKFFKDHNLLKLSSLLCRQKPPINDPTSPNKSHKQR